MIIYTSYFAVMNRLPHDIVPISIARKTPDGVSIAKLEELFPPWDMISRYKETGDWEYYTQDYNDRILSKYTQKYIQERIASITGGADACLLCYEGKGNCHRHLVSALLNLRYITSYEFDFRRYS